MSEEQLVPERFRPSPPMNLLNVNPEMIRRMYLEFVAPALMESGEALKFEIERAVRRILMSKATPSSIVAAPTSIAASFAVDADAVFNDTISRIYTMLDVLEHDVEHALSTGSVVIERRTDDGRVEQVKEDVSKLPDIVAERVKSVEVESFALVLALQRLAALYMLNLPPQYRPAILNMIVEGIDVVQHPPEEAGIQNIQELVKALSEHVAAAETGGRRRRRR